MRDEMRKLLNIALGRYYAPPIPVAIVALLQARAFRESLDLSQSTYGYYYELLIKRSLARGNIGQDEYDVMLGYLTMLVDRLHQEQRMTWNEEWFLTFHRTFNEEQGLRLTFRWAVDTLLERGVLVHSESDDTYEFRYGYFYYFFAARALAEGLATTEGRTRVEAETHRLDHENAANVLLFLTHFTKDAAVIDPMLAQAARVFSDIPIATLDSATISIPDLATVIHSAIYVERPVLESRRQFLEALDANPMDEQEARPRRPHANGIVLVQPLDSCREARLSENPANHVDAGREARNAEVAELNAFLDRMLAAFRTMQILGQLLKNFPGTLKASQKLRVTRATYDVGLRLLSALHRLFSVHRDGIIDDIVATLRNAHPDLNHNKLQTRALDTIGWYVYVASYGIVQRTAVSVGTPHLVPIFEQLQTEDPTPAIRLITIALELDRVGGFSLERIAALSAAFAKNPIALRVLNTLVLTHFYLFDVARETKQEVCAMLGIEYRAVGPGIDSRLKRIAAAPEAKA
jgi:hypothetical protein